MKMNTMLHSVFFVLLATSVCWTMEGSFVGHALENMAIQCIISEDSWPLLRERERAVSNNSHAIADQHRYPRDFIYSPNLTILDCVSLKPYDYRCAVNKNNGDVAIMYKENHVNNPEIKTCCTVNGIMIAATCCLIGCY